MTPSPNALRTVWRSLTVPLLAATLLALAAAPGLARERLPGPVQADVLKVRDGDTLAVRARIWLGQVVDTNVHLAGIDTPELRGRCHRERRMASAARAFVTRKLDGRPVTLRDIRFGKYAGRVVARVFTASGEDLGEALIAAGLGRRYRGRRRASWCEQAEQSR